ncbi:MAG: hypothetical protein U0325_03835 [Polyangiales bacterium]
MRTRPPFRLAPGALGMCFAFLASCAEQPATVIGPDVDAGSVVDVGITDLGGAMDRGVVADDRPTAGDVVDAPPPADVPFRCTDDMTCVQRGLGTACDLSSGNCVACLAERDQCPPAQHCDGASRTCVQGCRADEGCGTAVADGGVAGPRRYCDTNSRSCVECREDAHCLRQPSLRATPRRGLHPHAALPDRSDLLRRRLRRQRHEHGPLRRLRHHLHGRERRASLPQRLARRGIVHDPLRRLRPHGAQRL